MITALTVYLSIGAVIWLVLDRISVIERSFGAARAAGTRIAAQALVLATLMMIVAWPVFVFVWLKGMARA